MGRLLILAGVNLCQALTGAFGAILVLIAIGFLEGTASPPWLPGPLGFAMIMSALSPLILRKDSNQ